jgi:endoglucanase
VGWTERTLLRGDVALFAWRYDPRAPNPVADTNNASDGDMLIAWA